MALSPTSSHGSSSSSGGGTLLYDFEVVGADQATIDTFVDGSLAGLISGSYKVLTVYTYLRTDEAAAQSDARLKFNNDGAANYGRELLRGLSAVASAATTAGLTSLPYDVPGASATASIFGAGVVVIPNYAGTVGKKSSVSVAGNSDTAAVQMLHSTQSYIWGNTAALTRIGLSIASGAGQKFKVGSRLTIFGS